MNKGIRLYIILAALMVVSCCQSGELNFRIRFEEIGGLKSGDEIIFDGSTVGKVGKVLYTQDGDYIVDASVKHEFVYSVTRDSEFYITNDPRLEETKVVEIVQKKTGGVVLSNGEIVNGSVKPTILEHIFDSIQEEAHRTQDQLEVQIENFKKSLQRNSKSLGNTLDELAEQFSNLSEKLEKVPDSQEMKKLEEKLGLLADELEQSQKTIREKIQKDFIPEIQKRINKLRESLERYNRENEIDPLDSQLKKMRAL